MTAAEIIPSTSGKFQKVYAGLIDENGDLISPSNPLSVDVILDIEQPSDTDDGGDVTIGVSEVELTFSGITKYIHVYADEGNTGIIFIGKTGVQNDGTQHSYKLLAGDDVFIPYDDSTNALFAISDTASQTITKSALK